MNPARSWRAWVLGLAALAAQGQGLLPGNREARPRSASPHQDCAVCHRNHQDPVVSARSAGSALESLCLSCHQAKDGAPTVDRVPRLPLLPVEGSSHLRNGPGHRGIAYQRTVQLRSGRTLLLRMDCSGCHDSHGKDPSLPRTEAFDTRGQLLGSRPTSYAQICFGCHAGLDAAPTRRTDPDLGLRFASGAASRHRIGATAAGRPDLPSLRTSRFRVALDCTSCHDSPDAAGMRGPHVSTYPSLLKAPYAREKELGQGGERANELCFTCHEQSSILADQSFPLHSQHITGFLTTPRREPVAPAPSRIGRDPRTGRSQGFLAGYGEPTPCSTCHDPHGSPRNPALVQFDRSVVSASSVGGVDYVRAGFRQGMCTLTCHGHDHVQARY